MVVRLLHVAIQQLARLRRDKGKRHGDTASATMLLTMAADEDIAPIDLHRLPGGERATADDYQHTSTGWGTVRRRDAGLDL